MARLGSFSAAARELEVAPSVVTKRITQLEQRLKTKLILRSTRGLALTAAGERFLPPFLRVVAELDELFALPAEESRGVTGHLRIKSPTTITSAYLGALFAEFLVCHPRVTLELVLLDRSVNPLEEGFDLVVGARPASYPNVLDVPLCTYPQVLCCAPEYLKTRPAPREPGELVDHDCLTTVLFGTTWMFETARGAVSVEVRSKFQANDGRVVLEGVRRGLGIAPLPRYLVEQDLRARRVVPLLEGYTLGSVWLKALVPRIKMQKPAVRELVSFLKTHVAADHIVGESAGA